ncbi:Prenyltransferase and squalene oxidase repeat protein [Roseimaritima ulvae]|uniref:Prenyltransferase and squalene oxidase repeat protein n=2 Tax=Roseimaritima ulvae TaxID=980254 RepID=A0A5B9QL15_9BACT|nr:Prenyltransferase and squalene oxidase repeat protein [Roseimaritima ulvae]
MWNDPRVVWPIAALAIILMLATWWLLRRGRKRRPRAAAVCIVFSVVLHVLLFWLVPLITQPAGGSDEGDGQQPAPVAEISISDFTTEPLADSSSAGDALAAPPLPMPSPAAPVEPEPPSPVEPPPKTIETLTPDVASLAAPPALTDDLVDAGLDDLLNDLLLDDAPTAAIRSDAPAAPRPVASSPVAAAPASEPAHVDEPAPTPTVPAIPAIAASARVVGGPTDDFANRSGDAKAAALRRRGGDEHTEAAVEAALRWLAHYQRPDGSWDPTASGAGQERAPLGEARGGAGRRCTSAITGLALLSMLGSGNTHREGPYAANVHAGLSYLIRNQAPDGSLAGRATQFARTYSHGMATLAMCEAAAMTKDPQAIAAARAAIAYSQRQQHPTTGGWRYRRGETGDTSQLGWQAMALHSAQQADIALNPRTMPLIHEFLRSVRGGQQGGLARYRPGQAESRTMTAEALAIRLLLDEPVPAAEIREAEASLLEELPGDGQANYYYWYYASLALHQLQSPAWDTWNARLKQELLRTQQADGSWPTDSVWGGYGGRVYTTALGALSLEVYYRHR